MNQAVMIVMAVGAVLGAPMAAKRSGAMTAAALALWVMRKDAAASD